ncbi:MAG: hypothetical protein ACKVRN_00750 [Pyrinomonadaceae bacterium]
MRCRKFACLIFSILLIGSFCIAQTQPNETDKDNAKKADSEKEKKSDPEKDKKKKELNDRALQILDAAISEASNLRLPENRAVVYGVAGDIYWKFDEKRARDLFRNAAAEILLFNQETDKEKRESNDPYFAIFDLGDIRGQILPLIARHDAELALELLLQTRSAKLTEAMLKAAQPNAKTDSGYMNYNPENYRVKAEIALEQQFALLAADENPEKAIKLIKDSLAKGISWNVMPLLQKLNNKNEKKAVELAGDIVKKIADTDLTKKTDYMSSAISFLQYATKPNPTAIPKEKPFKFTDSQTKELANKIADTLLQPASKSIATAMTFSRAMPLLEKLVPERIALLKMSEAASQSGLPSEVKQMQQREKLWDANSTPEDILALLPKMQNEFEKVSAYQSLATKISQIEDETRAKKLIEQIPDEKARANAQERFESARIARSAAEGKLDEARKQIGNLTKKKSQIQQLVSLATEFQKKGTEKDAETAKALMKDAKALTNDRPDDEDELNDLMEVVKGYAVVEPEIAFRIFDPIVDQISDVVQATAILSKYNKRNRAFKKGELVMKVKGSSWDSMLIFRYIAQMQLLGKADLDRMNTLSDRFMRSDSRTIVKLAVLQGFMKDDKKADAPGTTGDMIMFDDF